MKKLLLPIMLIFFASYAFSAPFSPSIMKLNIPQKIQYQFSGSSLTVPITVTGAPGTALLLLYTSGKSNSIVKVRNGYLGWHYMNKVDTCLFVSGPITLAVGSNTYVWNGKNNSGVTVPPGDYSYYMFAFDNKSPKTLACAYYNLGYSYPLTLEVKDVKGANLPNPIMYLNGNSKWKIGTDPQDSTLKETTAFRGGFSRGQHIGLDPVDHTKVFVHESEGNNQYVLKYSWVPNGAAVIDTKWSTNGISVLGACPDKYTVLTGAYTDGQTIWASSAFPLGKTGNAELYFADVIDGSVTKKLNLNDWYVSLNDMNKGGQYNGGPDGIYFRNNILYTQGLESCMTVAIDPYQDTDANMIKWANGNGDYTHDHNWEVNSKTPWVCNDYNVGPYTYSIAVDANNFSIFPAYDMGAVSFCAISGVDGKGLGYFSFAGETADLKYTDQFVDEGTAWDGIYTDNSSTTATAADKQKKVWFVAHDSIKGSISNATSVNETAPAMFSVDQNTPNPFNPATTINFSLVKAGKVTVEIFNAAGQKVDTLINTSMNAGPHSVTWNASKFSGGVYFYTVKSGETSRTMKMTLMK
jgi:flagellar hook assembly protein FlgD